MKRRKRHKDSFSTIKILLSHKTSRWLHGHQSCVSSGSIMSEHDRFRYPRGSRSMAKESADCNIGVEG
jgi:hypothetical protein